MTKTGFAVAIVTALLALAIPSLVTAADSTTLRTPYGLPDLQGVWNFSSDVPMQRPVRFGTQEFLTDEQLQEARQALEAQRRAADAREAELQIDPDAPPVTDVVISGYNAFWFELAGLGDIVRTSHIVYPEDGRIPVPKQDAVQQYGGLGIDSPGRRPVRFLVGGVGAEGPEDRGLSERCLVGFNSGPPFYPSLYNNNLQIIQNRDTVAILTENIHDARIVPLSSRAPLNESIGLWSGDSRGWWEGDTLVVETRNFNGLRQSLGAWSLSFGGPDDNFSYGDNLQTVLTEKFTRQSEDILEYEFTIDDPATFTDKITAVITLVSLDSRIYEYACHEGNYGMRNILRGARVGDNQGSEFGSGPSD